MNSKNKRGISAIVATVLIILITVAAVTIIWAAIIPMISGNLDRSKICFDAIQELKIADEGFTCSGPGTDDLSVQISRGSKNIDLAGIQFITYDTNGNAETQDLNTNLPGINGKRVYESADNGGSASTVKVEIAPIIKIGNSNYKCDISSSMVIKPCAQ